MKGLIIIFFLIPNCNLIFWKMVYFGMKPDISGFNSAISNKWTTAKMKSLPPYKDNVVFVDAEDKRAKYLSLLL